MPGRAPRQKGDRFERHCVQLLKGAGIDAERVPLSGSAGGSHVGDVQFTVRDDLGLERAECKKRKRAWLDLYEYLSKPDVRYLFVARDRAEPLVVMSMDTFQRLLQLVQGQDAASLEPGDQERR